MERATKRSKKRRKGEKEKKRKREKEKKEEERRFGFYLYKAARRFQDFTISVLPFFKLL
jgi:hypothetical protein